MINLFGNVMTFNMCDLDLGDRYPIVALCTSPDNGDYLFQVILKTFWRFKLWSGHKM